MQVGETLTLEAPGGRDTRSGRIVAVVPPGTVPDRNFLAAHNLADHCVDFGGRSRRRESYLVQVEHERNSGDEGTLLWLRYDQARAVRASRRKIAERQPCPSRKILLRMPEKIHLKLRYVAEQLGVSVNLFLLDRIEGPILQEAERLSRQKA